MTHAVIAGFSALGVLGQLLIGVLVVSGLLWLVGVRRPLELIRMGTWGDELWLVFLVSAVATLGSLFFSEIADFVPCELCWWQRIFMYPLAVTTLVAAVFNDHRAARYLLPLPVLGAGVSTYHLLVERGVVEQTQACLVSAPGGCATKWVEEFGYVTIPTLALTGFALIFAFLLFALVGAGEGAATVSDRCLAGSRASDCAPPKSRRPSVAEPARDRRRRGSATAAAMIVLVAAAAGLVFALTGDDSKDATVTSSRSVEEVEGAGEAQQLLQRNRAGRKRARLPVRAGHGLRVHRPAVPVLPAVRDPAMPTLIEQYVRTGKAKVELRPLAFIGMDSERGRDALIAGAKQDKMFNVAQLLFVNQGAENAGWLSDDLVRRVAASVPGMDVQRLLSDAGSREVADEGAAFDAAAQAAGVNSSTNDPRWAGQASPQAGHPHQRHRQRDRRAGYRSLAEITERGPSALAQSAFGRTRSHVAELA